MRIRKNIRELLGDLIPNSPNKSHNNGMADVRRITNRIFGAKGLRQAIKYRHMKYKHMKISKRIQNCSNKFSDTAYFK